MTTSLVTTDPVPANGHHHALGYVAISATECITSMKRKTATTEEKPNVIYSNNLDNLSAEANWLYHLVHEDIIKRTLCNQRSKLYPPVPERLTGQTPEGKQKTTAGPDPKPFLFFDNGPGTDSRVITFGFNKELQSEALGLLASIGTCLMAVAAVSAVIARDSVGEPPMKNRKSVYIDL